MVKERNHGQKDCRVDILEASETEILRRKEIRPFLGWERSGGM